MFVNAYVTNNTGFDKGIKISIKLRTRNGPENMSRARSSLLTDFIDFRNFFFLFSRIVLDTDECDVFKKCRLRLYMVIQ